MKRYIKKTVSLRVLRQLFYGSTNTNRLWLLLCIICFALPVTAQSVKDRLSHFMDDYAKNGDFNGVVLVAKKGSILLNKGYGYKNLETQAKHNENSIFRIGQITEALTAEIILQLDSKGQLGLDERIIKYIPAFPGAEKVSIRNLLTHTSGIDTYIPDLTIQKNKVCRPMNMETFIESYHNKHLLFEPGTIYHYSNADYILLGFIIEKISKVHYDDEMGYKISSVCAMRHTGFEFSALKDENKATGYYHSNKLLPVSPNGDTAVLYSAYGMYSTASDLYKWHEALRWYKLLPKDWQELAYVPVKNNYALGWFIEHMYNKRFMEQDGSYAGFTGSVIRQEEDDVFIVVLENKMQQGYHNMELAKNLLKTLSGPDGKKQDRADKQEHTGNENSLKKFTGKYVFNADYTLTIKLNGGELTVESPDQQPIALVSESETVFKTKGAEVTIEFVADAKGAVNKLVLHQNGQNNTGKRVK